MNSLSGVRTSTMGWLVVGPFVAEEPKHFAAGFVVAAVASYVPDIEHENSTAGRAVGKAPSKIVRKIAGGHRGLTHSLFFALLTSTLMWWIMDDRFGVRMQWFMQALIGDVFTGNWSGIWYHYLVLLGLVHSLAHAVFVGVHAHIFCDLLTVQGTAYLSPFWRKKIRIANLRTGSRAEEWYLALVNVLTAMVVLYHVTGLFGAHNA